jgi:putative nucleotidyltransferase with HDIG domain
MTKQDSEHFISVDQLQPGVYIHIDLHWMDHPFGFNSFKIKSVDQIRTLKQLKVTQVRYDPDKSDVRPLPVPAASVNAPSEPDLPAPEEIQVMQAKRARIERLKQQREAISRVEKEFVTAANTVRNISRNIFSRPKETIQDADQLIQKMSDSLLADNDVAIHVMNEKIGAEDMYFHSLNVTVLSLMVAREMKLAAEQIRLLGLGALFHDIGKTEIPDKILLKVDPLTKSERDFLQQHCDYGVDIAKKVDLPQSVIDIVHQHHECYDGSGYPQQLKGEQISQLAQIVAIVNQYDNLCNHVNVANSLTPHEALSLMFAQQRAKYAPAPLNIFIRCLGVYPPGTVVKLSNDALAIVTSVNPSRPLKPVVLVHDPEIPKDEAIMLDLDREPDINISKAIRPSQLPRPVFEYLSPRKRVSYYFDSQEQPTTPVAKS